MGTPNIGPDSTIYLEYFTVSCISGKLDSEAIKLVIYVEERDQRGVVNLEFVAENEWKVDGRIFWIPEINVVRFTVVDQAEDISFGSICVYKGQLEESIRKDDSEPLEMGMKDENGYETSLTVTFQVALEEEDNSSDNPVVVNAQAKELRELFKSTGIVEYLNSSIVLYRAAAEAIPDEYPPVMIRFKHDTYSALNERYEKFGSVDDLEECISTLRSIIGIIAAPDAEAYIYTMNLGSCFLRRFERLGEIADLELAIETHEHTISLISQENPDLPGCLVNLATSRLRLYEINRDLEDLEKSIKALEDGLVLSPSEVIVLPSLLSTLGFALMRRAELKYCKEDIDRAIEVQRTAVALLPDGDDDMPRWLNNLGNSLSTRYEHHKDLQDINESIHVQNRALILTPPNYKNHHKQSSNLGLSLMLRFRHTSSLNDIEQSIILHRHAITGEDDVADKWLWMQHLSSALYLRYQKFGVLADLEEAISMQQRAVSVVGENTPGRAGAYSALAMQLYQRFNRTQNVNDIDTAIEAARGAVKLSLEGHPDMLEIRNYLSVCLYARFERTDNPDDISEALQSQRLVLKDALRTSPNYTLFMINFSTCLLSKFERDGDLDALYEAIQVLEQVVDKTDPQDSLLPGRLANLGRSLLYHFQRNHEDSMIHRSIDVYRKAIELTPDNHVDQAQYYSNLGDAYAELFRSSGSVSDFRDAIVAFGRSATHPAGAPTVRLIAGRAWAIACKGQEFYEEAFTAYSVCFENLPQVVSLGQTIMNRHIHLKSLSTLATEAAAVAIQLGKTTIAVEWLEQGRNVVWNQLNNLRSPVDDLREVHPDLAGELSTVSGRLQHAGSRTQSRFSIYNISQGISLQDEVIEHQNSAHDWETLVDSVRKLPGFDKFLKPLTFEEITAKLPNDGHVVIINLDRLRCDALAVTRGSQEPLHIPLVGFDIDTCEQLRRGLERILKRHNLLVRDVRGGRPVMKKGTSNGFEMVLRDLWKFIANPVLDQLKIATNTNNPRRLWWCTTGALSFLPLHAAGLYAAATINAPSRVPDLVVSSYTPTLSALFDRTTHRVTKQKFEGFLAVCQPNTPNLPSIPQTEAETKIATDLFVAEHLRCSRLVGEAATHDKVLLEMGNYSWIHFACHALQHENDPTKSAIYLHDGQLAISDIIQKSLPHADFAFLSACQTATGDRQLSEEAVHLAAGMLSAGYRSIIASMWSISDDYAPMVAKEVYQYLLCNVSDGGSPDSSSSAKALHAAINKVRRNGNLQNVEDMSFLTWVPFIHIGR